ncbi:MAG TPA: DNA-directed DNA polymerase [Methanoregulaceae archaeon]|nr:DNA-directed DNA polymerase [Methanoregulaceae archaeon]HPD10017.1 DNA-directed DNA polymerase [Methanoregulaceae archaeon]HRT15023.1 DNA-directed DNA polymerase [Methanoregulaceae archaeon]HRU30594.1 DNA-directed DNA polymerase [Methanoregulaceae archaeon]
MTGPVSIDINQLEYSVGPGGPVIHIFGRDLNRNAHHLQVTGFRPYFYAPAAQVDGRAHPAQVTVEEEVAYRSIRGEMLRRLYTIKPTDVREIRDRYNHYEADIPFTTRFMIDTALTGGVSAPSEVCMYEEVRPADVSCPARICILDIECEDVRGFPDPARDAVICITCWDSYAGDYTSFIFSPGTDHCDLGVLSTREGLENGCFCAGTHDIRTFQTERSMLEAFSGYIRERDPDILSGWNFLEFDLPYLVKRMEVLGQNPVSLARLEGMTERNALRGRTVFDLLSAYRKMHATQQESYRLDAVAEVEIGETKVRYTGTISELWKNDPCLLVEYNFKDVELCVAINQKNRIIEFYREIARYVGCPLERTLNSSSVIDVFVLRKAFGRYVLPSKGFAPSEEFEGATVFEPSRGVRENVVVLDLKSLYPMAMMTINASPETKDPGGELKAPNGIRFRKEPDGLTRSIISDLLVEREEKKKMRNQFPFNSPEYILYDLQQNVLKVIMNTYYGVSGYTRFRLYDREIGAAVTSVGRAIIEHTRSVIEALGYRVIYGDTDSCMVLIPPGNLEETIGKARTIEEAVNRSYTGFARQELAVERHYFSIKFEKIYRRFFQAGKKKRYAGHLVWKEGKEADEIDVVGFEIRRSDSPQITRAVQKRVMEMILHGEEYESVRDYLADIIRNYRAGKYSLDEIGIPGGIGKDLSDYQTDDAHIRGARYSNEHLGMEFAKGSKPKRVYIKNVTAKYRKTDVLCFEYGDQVPPEFQVDWELMLEKTLRQPISRIIEALGWKWTDIDPSRTTLAQWGIG